MTRGIGRCAAFIGGALLVGSLATAAGADEDAYHRLTTLESHVELGALYTSSSDYKFGDYTDLVARGFNVLGNLDVHLRSPWDADLPYHVRLRGMNLGLDSRRIDALAEMPGRFDLFFFMDEIPKYQTDSARSPYLGVGSQILTLPPGWDPGTNPSPAQMSTLEASLRELNLSHQRRTLGGGASVVLTDRIDFDASYRRQTKRGDKLTAGLVGRTGGDPRSILIPEPIDYTFHQIDSHLRYNGERVQVQLEYFGSSFENDQRWLRWQNPYIDDGGPSYDPAQQYPAFAQKGTPPDNWFHQGVLSAGVNLPLRSRLMLNTAFGWGRQDDEFLPYTLDPGFDNFANIPLPRNDLDGKIRTGMASLRFTSNPLPKLGITLGYRWDERDNDTPVDTYFRVLADTGEDGVADPDQDPANRRINRPYGWDKQHVDADLSYQVLPRTRLFLSYDFEQMNRTHQEVEESEEHSYTVKLTTRPFQRVNGGVRVTRAYRKVDDYDCITPLIESEPPQIFIDDGDVPGCLLNPDGSEVPGVVFENHPEGRKFNQAERRRSQGYLWANFLLPFDVNLGFNLRYNHDDYYDSDLGLTARRSWAPGMDLSWALGERARFHAFYEWEDTRSKQDSIDNDGGDYPLSRGWSGRDRDVVHTAGFGADFVAIPDRWTFGVDYLYARSRSIVDVDVNTELLPNGFPYPDDTTQLHDASFRTEIQVTPNLAFRLGYLFEHFESRDVSLDRVCVACLNLNPGTSAAVIGVGAESPDYDVHVGSLSVILSFQ